MTLSFVPAGERTNPNGERIKYDSYFEVATADQVKAEKAGLTLLVDSKTRLPKLTADGRRRYYTATATGDKLHTFNPYAVLAFYDEATPAAKAHLDNIQRDYNKSWAIESTKHYESKDPNKPYRPFQHSGIEFGVEYGNVLIGDEPGLGKTAQAIGIANETRAKNMLIICPASIRLNWQRELKNWWMPPSGEVYSHAYMSARQGSHRSSADINAVIISYELTRNEGVHNDLMKSKWDQIVLDEAHYLKSIDAERTRAIFGGGNYKDNHLSKRAGSIVALTGTPLPNRPRECFTLAKALCPESIDWMSYDDFVFRFNPSQRMQTADDKVFNVEKRGRLPELNARLRSNFMVRRLKKDVLKDLPDKTYELTYLEPTGAIQDVLRRESLLKYSIVDLKNPFGDMFGMISTIRKEMGIAKVPRVVEHMKYLLDIEEIPKIVLFAHHVEVMNMLTEALAKYGVVAVRGGMSSKAKDNSVQSFQTDIKKRVFLGQMDSAGFGIDGLQNVCSHVIFAEPAWVPGTNEQAVDRCHRIGQHANVIAQFLVAEGSFDEKVLATVFEKNETIYNVLDKVH
jgi:SWI/SNF-related matrix-associated actin-dependent regulator 1 of chromatin subfamily A